MKRLLLVLAGLAGLIGAVGIKDQFTDERAAREAVIATHFYGQQFPIRTSRKEAELLLNKSGVQTVRRGDDEVFIIVQEGASPFYCSHKYYGTMLLFKDAMLTQVSDQTLFDTCL